MKKIILLILFSLFSLNIAVAGEYEVLRVIDGDTIDIMYQGQRERVRMLCVDTPESVHPDQSKNTTLGQKSSAYTKSRLSGKKVDLELESKTRGKYGRLLAYVILDGKNYNLELIRESWSKYYTKYGNSEKHDAEFRAAEAAARAKGIRVWSPGQNNNAPPKQVAAGQYHGNTSSHKFHNPGCRYYNCKECTKLFSTRDDAISSGYTPCKICKP